MKAIQTRNRELVCRVIRKVFGNPANARTLNGERALQCALYKAFLEEELDDSHQVLVEPMVKKAEPEHMLDLNERTIKKKLPDLLLVRRPSSNSEGKIDVCLELKFTPWGDVKFEEDIDKLSNYRRAKRLMLRHQFDLLNGGNEELTWFCPHSETVWGFVAVGQASSHVATPKEIRGRLADARRRLKNPIAPTTNGEGILAACLIAKSPRFKRELRAPTYWVADLLADEIIEGELP